MLIFQEMKTETAQKGVANDSSTIIESLDRLMLELRRVNKKSHTQRAAVVRLNQEARVLLEQIQAHLQAA